MDLFKTDQIRQIFNKPDRTLSSRNNLISQCPVGMFETIVVLHNCQLRNQLLWSKGLLWQLHISMQIIQRIDIFNSMILMVLLPTYYLLVFFGRTHDLMVNPVLSPFSNSLSLNWLVSRPSNKLCYMDPQTTRGKLI